MPKHPAHALYRYALRQADLGRKGITPHVVGQCPVDFAMPGDTLQPYVYLSQTHCREHAVTLRQPLVVIHYLNRNIQQLDVESGFRLLAVCRNPQAAVILPDNVFPCQFFKVCVGYSGENGEHEHVPDETLGSRFQGSGKQPFQFFGGQRLVLCRYLLRLKACKRVSADDVAVQCQQDDFVKQHEP